MICPKCGMEFKEGVLKCTDCGTDLVDSMTEHAEEKTFLISLPSDYAERINDFFVYSHIDTELTPAEKEGYTDILIAESQLKEAAKLASVFISQEPIPRPEGELTEEEETEEMLYSPSGREYKRAKTRYDEAVSTGYTFIGFSVALFAIILDSVSTKFLPTGSALMYVVFFCMAVGLIFGAVKYLTSLSSLKAEIVTEAENEAAVTDWLKMSYADTAVLDEKVFEIFGETSMEEQELNRSSFLNTVLGEAFPAMSKEFLEFESELYLNGLAEKEEEFEGIASSENIADSADTEE